MCERERESDRESERAREREEEEEVEDEEEEVEEEDERHIHTHARTFLGGDLGCGIKMPYCTYRVRYRPTRQLVLQIHHLPTPLNDDISNKKQFTDTSKSERTMT